MSEDLKNNDIVFPTKEIFKKDMLWKILESNETLQDAWTEMKTK